MTTLRTQYAVLRPKNQIWNKLNVPKNYYIIFITTSQSFGDEYSFILVEQELRKQELIKKSPAHLHSPKHCWSRWSLVCVSWHDASVHSFAVPRFSNEFMPVDHSEIKQLYGTVILPMPHINKCTHSFYVKSVVYFKLFSSHCHSVLFYDVHMDSASHEKGRTGQVHFYRRMQIPTNHKSLPLFVRFADCAGGFLHLFFKCFCNC